MSGDLSSSGHTINCIATPQLVAEEWVFGGSSYLSLPDHSDWTLAGDFTIEAFGIKFASVTATQAICALYETVSPGENRSFLCTFDGAASPKRLQFSGSTGGTSATLTTVGGDFSPTINAPYNLCWERSGSTLRVYAGAVGGDLTMLGSGTLAGALFNASTPLTVGVQNPGSLANYLNGRLKALRITNGTARYATATSYTPPTLPLPTS